MQRDIKHKQTVGMPELNQPELNQGQTFEGNLQANNYNNSSKRTCSVRELRC